MLVSVGLRWLLVKCTYLSLFDTITANPRERVGRGPWWVTVNTKKDRKAIAVCWLQVVLLGGYTSLVVADAQGQTVDMFGEQSLGAHGSAYRYPIYRSQYMYTSCRWTCNGPFVHKMFHVLTTVGCGLSTLGSSVHWYLLCGC